MEGLRIWAGVGESLLDARFYSCPIADISAGRTPALMRIHRLLNVEGVKLSDIVKRPTAALLDGLDVIRQEQHAIAEDRARRERTAREAEARARKGRAG